MFGLFNRARQNWEGIVYAIVSIFLLERVRTGWNRIERAGKKNDIGVVAIRRRQQVMLAKASLLYALPFLLPVVKYVYRSIEELSWSVPGLLVLKNSAAFFVVLGVTEVFLAIVMYHLLRVYIDRLNAASGFFRRLGRNVWDGSVHVVQASVRAGVNASVRASSSVAGSVKRRTKERVASGLRHSRALMRHASVLKRPFKLWRHSGASTSYKGTLLEANTDSIGAGRCRAAGSRAA